MAQQFQPPIPTLPGNIQALLHPSPTLICDSLPDYLTNSMIHVLRDSSRHATKRRRGFEKELREAGLDLGGPGPSNSAPGRRKEVDEELEKKRLTEEEEKEVEAGLKDRLEAIGRVVGAQITEHISIHRPPPPTHLEMVKFICKELFLYVYAKQIDNLRTNHRGTFVLQSNALPPLIPLSTVAGPAADLENTKMYLAYPAAMIQGALAKLGLNATVTAESSGLPQCTFQIKTSRNQPVGSAYSTLTGNPATAGGGVAK